MQIKINLKIFIFIIIFYLTRQIEIYGILMLFAFFHELGHLICGLVLGFKPQALNISPVGLSISFEIKAEDYNNKIRKANKLTLKKLFIALAGPTVNFLIVIISALFKVNLFGISKDIVIYSNILIGMFNLIPIYPLDGGRILRCLLHIVEGLKTSYTYINIVSNVSAVVLTIFSSIAILYVKNVSIIIIVAYLWYLVISENKTYGERIKVYELIRKIDEENENLQVAVENEKI